MVGKYEPKEIRVTTNRSQLTAARPVAAFDALMAELNLGNTSTLTPNCPSRPLTSLTASCAAFQAEVSSARRANVVSQKMTEATSRPLFDHCQRGEKWSSIETYR